MLIKLLYRKSIKLRAGKYARALYTFFRETSRVYLTNNDCSLVCVGGDGLFHEAINGLFWRQQKEQFGEEAGKCDPLPCRTRLGIIPAGQSFYNSIIRVIARLVRIDPPRTTASPLAV